MKNLHIPRTMGEVLHSRITLVTGTAAATTAVIFAYNYMRNADGDILLDVATGNLISMVQTMLG